MLKVNYVCRPSHFEYAKIVKKICALFSSEDPAIYYIPPNETHKNAHGKLPNKVKNLEHDLQKDTRISLSSVKCVLETLFDEKTKIIDSVQLEGSINRKDSAVKTVIICLKHESWNSWPQLLMNWSVTQALRRKRLLDTRSKSQTLRIQSETSKTQEKNNDKSENEKEQLVDKYIEKWDILKLPNGYLLLNQDFKELFSGREEGLLSKWETAKELITELAEIEIPSSDIYGRHLLKRYYSFCRQTGCNRIIFITIFVLQTRAEKKHKSHPISARG
ncbi:uncharacterized protein [Anoplolepis gracilipes]|uniref:uncharacterized protein n=1 Tax=Anoplolepis gracilipes TaxID=354296 RepID=UPI003BA0E28F